MPCIDPDADRRYISELNSRVQELTALLCEACGLLEAQDIAGSVPLRAWHLEHKAKDAARAQEEQDSAWRRGVVEAALAKLTDEERRILGIQGG
jgi:hypothetical protein